MFQKLKNKCNKLFRYRESKGHLYNPYKQYHKNNSCIFIHIPKTGGTSILYALNGGKSAIRYHTAYQDFLKHNPSLFKEFFKFSFVRNPFDKIYSAYSYLLEGGDQDTDLPLAEEINRYRDLDDFIINGLGKGLYRCHPLFLPQSNFIVKHDETIMVDFVGKFENFADDWKKISEKLDLAPKLSKQNTSKRYVKYKVAYNNRRSIEIIDLLYKQDLVRWNYNF